MIEIVAVLAYYVLAAVVGWTIGTLLTAWQERRQRAREAREAKLQAEWQALLATQRLNVAFMEARRAMWEEAIRQRHQRGAP